MNPLFIVTSFTTLNFRKNDSLRYISGAPPVPAKIIVKKVKSILLTSLLQKMASEPGLNSELKNILKNMEYKGGEQIKFSTLKADENLKEKFPEKPKEKAVEKTATKTVRLEKRVENYSF